MVLIAYIGIAAISAERKYLIQAKENCWRDHRGNCIPRGTKGNDNNITKKVAESNPTN